MSFAHLHCHTHYSLLDGASKIDELVARCKSLGMASLAVTDHGNLHGALEFYKECHKQGINPIIGYEAYVVSDRKSKDKSNRHLTILAKNRVGYQNLLKLSSEAFLGGFYSKPRIDYELLAGHGEGLIILSGCMGSNFAHLVQEEDWSSCIDHVKTLQRIAGDDFYIEIMRNGKPVQEYITTKTIEFANKHGLPMVATADCHYVNPEDADVQDVLMCVATGARRCQKDRFRLDGDQYYLRTPEEMHDQFKDVEEAVHQSGEIAKRVDIQLSLGTRHFPLCKDIPAGSESVSVLSNMCLSGLARRLHGHVPVVYQERIEREIGVIKELGFCDYFLIVADLVEWANNRGIMSTARGSGVGSLVCYSLNISHVDPVKYNLLFERFLDLSRREAPDIDMDFDKDRRGEVMMYVKEKYGHDCVAQIGTFGTMAAKSAINDVGRVNGIPLQNVERITKLVPDLPGTTIEDCFEVPEFRDIYDNDTTSRSLIDMAMKCEGTARNMGTHAAAVVIAPGPLTEYVPLAKMAGKSDVLTQWDMHMVEEAGLMKMDFLGLRNLTVLSECIKAIHESTGVVIDLHKLPMDDEDTFNLLCNGETKGVFQLESKGMTSLLMKMGPSSVEHICACIALYRPGPLDAGMVSEYVARKNGEKDVVFPDESLGPTLESTYGVMVYQEQVMQVLHRLGNIPLEESYSCVKAISKKIPEKVGMFRERFVRSCDGKGVPGKKIWDQIKTFARYGFNRSHSMAYAMIAYQTAWLKAHYPVEFMASILNSDIPDRNFKRKDRLVGHLEDCRRMGITVHSPNVNRGGARFKVEGGEMLFGLQAVKGVSKRQADIIEERRGTTGYNTIVDFYSAVSKEEVPKATARNLIYVGAMDDLAGNRYQKEEMLARAIKLGEGGYASERTAEKASRMKAGPDNDPLPLEKEYVGYYVTGHPTDRHDFLGSTTCRPGTLFVTPVNSSVIIGGIVSGVRKGRTSNGKQYIGFQVEDRSGSCDCVLWSREAKRFGRLIVDGAVLLFKGVTRDNGADMSVTVKMVVPIYGVDWSVALVLKCGTLNEVAEAGEIIASDPGDTLVYCDWLDTRAVHKSRVKLSCDLIARLRDFCTPHLVEVKSGTDS